MRKGKEGVHGCGRDTHKGRSLMSRKELTRALLHRVLGAVVCGSMEGQKESFEHILSRLHGKLGRNGNSLPTELRRRFMKKGKAENESLGVLIHIVLCLSVLQFSRLLNEIVTIPGPQAVHI